MATDENGNPIVDEDEEDNQDNDNGQEEDKTDYKALLEQERAEKQKALESAEKRKGRFKAKAGANENKPVVDQDSIKRMVDESVGVVKFYSENKDANQYQADIEALVAKGIERYKAFKYVIAEKDPTLLLDDARKAQLSGNTALNGVPANLSGHKDPRAMSEEDIAKLSDEEFDKLFPSSTNTKKFYSDK